MRARLRCLALAGMFFLCAGTLAAWYDKVHIIILLKCIDLIRRNDPALIYEEFYQAPVKTWIAGGASDEDYVPAAAGMERSFRHYFDPDPDPKTGAGPRGVRYYNHYRAWVWLENAQVAPPQPGPFYEGTLDWALRVHPDNPLNWPGAIHAYNYTVESRQEAYARLGRVGHLLGDMSEPDHATITPHPGSGKMLPRDADEIFGANVLSRLRETIPDRKTMQAVSVLLMQKQALTRNRYLTRNLRTIGFEGLLEDAINFREIEHFFPATPEHHARLRTYFSGNRPAAPLEGQTIVAKSDPEDYFNGLARRAKASVRASGRRLALGTEDLNPLLPDAVIRTADVRWEPIFLIPAINVDSEAHKRPYYALGWECLTDAVNFNAGLFRMFADIVNQPPYVLSVVMRQQGGGSYAAQWEDETLQQETYTVVSRRALRKSSTAFVGERPIHLAITFGPVTGGFAERIEPSSVSVRLGGYELRGAMQSANRWETTFAPNLRAGQSEARATLQIEARDAHRHFPRPGLGPGGYALDRNPATPAIPGKIQPYDWKGYEYGDADTFHEIVVVPEERRESPAPPPNPVPQPRPAPVTPPAPEYDPPVTDAERKELLDAIAQAWQSWSAAWKTTGIQYYNLNPNTAAGSLQNDVQRARKRSELQRVWALFRCWNGCLIAIHGLEECKNRCRGEVARPGGSTGFGFR